RPLPPSTPLPYTTLFRSGLERSPPRLDAAVEDRLRAVAEVAEKEPEPRRHRGPRVVVDDDPRRPAHSGFAHLALELPGGRQRMRSEEHTSELQSRFDLVC